MSGTHQWLQKRKPVFPFKSISASDTILLRVKQAFHEQAELSLDNFFRGRLTKTWFSAHDIYFRL